jgi:hypothetical protein
MTQQHIARATEEKHLSGTETIVSRSGMRHLVGPHKAAHRGRVSTWCGFGIAPEDESPAALRECPFCKRELAIARKQANVS